MQASIAASVAGSVQKYSVWVKGAARVTFLLVFIKGAVWVGASWLALRGFSGL